jgi:competence ComEA-like helix-hairpin-helix protein
VQRPRSRSTAAAAALLCALAAVTLASRSPGALVAEAGALPPEGRSGAAWSGRAPAAGDRPRRSAGALARAGVEATDVEAAAARLRRGRPLDLNTATAAELELLPRVGPALAARIVAHREAHGPFARVEDLVSVRGIGPRTAARLAPLLEVSGAGGAPPPALRPAPPPAPPPSPQPAPTAPQPSAVGVCPRARRVP